MNLNAPKPFVYDKNKKGKDWIIWKKNFLTYLRLIEIDKKLRKEEEAFLLMNLIGDEGQKLRENMFFCFEEDEEDINVLIKKFDEIFIPTVNEIEERYTLFSRKKQNNESIDNYVVDLQEKAATCNFKNKIDDFIRDMVILNMEEYLQKKALQQELSLSEVILLYKQYCVDSERPNNICKDSNLSVNLEPGPSSVTKDLSCAISVKESSAKSVCWRCGTSHPPRTCPAWGKRCEACSELHHLTENCGRKQIDTTQSYFCKKCGTSHPYRQCPAYGATCINCLKKNHFNTQCKNEKVNPLSAHFVECDWCGSKHLPGDCPHDEACSTCDKYPHNLCFQCRENPHVDSCIFKEFVALPLLKSDDKSEKINSEDKISIVRERTCVWCETVYRPGADCPHDYTCTSCQDYPHKICFQCRQNPHTELCIFKNLVALPCSRQDQDIVRGTEAV